MDTPNSIGGNSLFRLAGWSAFLSAGATILGFLSLMLFFILGDPFGKINDISSIIIAMASLPMFSALHKLHHSASYILSLGALIVGVVAMAVAGVVQAIFVFGVIPYEQTAFISPLAFGIFGISVLVYGYLALISNSLPRRLTILGIAAGIGYALVGLGFILGGQNHPFSYVGGLVAVIAFPIWAIWLGRTFLKISGK